MSSGISDILKEWEVLEKEFCSVQVRLFLSFALSQRFSILSETLVTH